MALGFKTGGRKKGTPNKAKVERDEAIAVATQHAEEAGKSGRKLAVAVLSEAMNYFYTLAAKHQPTADNKTANENKFAKYLKLSASLARDLAPYESAKLQSTTLQTAPGDDEPVKIQIEFI